MNKHFGAGIGQPPSLQASVTSADPLSLPPLARPLASSDLLRLVSLFVVAAEL